MTTTEGWDIADGTDADDLPPAGEEPTAYVAVVGAVPDTPIFDQLVRDIEFADTFGGIEPEASVLDPGPLALPLPEPASELAPEPSQRFVIAVLAAVAVVLAVLLALAVLL